MTKRTLYEYYGLERKDPGFLAVVRAGGAAAARVMEEYEENARAIAAVQESLAADGIRFERAGHRLPEVEGRFGLVISVGGDGTLLAASHAVRDTPVAGVNSRPGRSVGYFCVADRHNFRRILAGILSGRRRARRLMRLDLFVNGRREGVPALNDLLVTSQNPAASSLYDLRLGECVEFQRSAGVWVSTPAGSTGGILSAGGKKMPLSERRMQFRVREPYRGQRTKYELDRGSFTQGFSITSFTPGAAVFLDGSRIVHVLDYGDLVEPRISAHDLNVFL